ncbi:hypothetical protein FWH09_01750 [Candidatus Saccharibacteria bacterium]|nr:hypothetical protein [Candidatus Saccharibacteria bacterium]
MKKTGVFCIALASIMAVSALTIGSRHLSEPAYAVPTPCGDIDTSGIIGGGSGGGSGGSGSGGSGGGAGGDGAYSESVLTSDGHAAITVEKGVNVVNFNADMVASGDVNFTTNNRTVELNIDFLALTCLQIFDNGVLIATIPVTPSLDWQNVRPIFDLTTVGSHQITVVGFDLYGNPLEANLVFNIVYDPNYEVPPTGVIRIGELAIARVDLITIISSIVVACGVFALLVVMKNRKREEKAARRR